MRLGWWAIAKTRPGFAGSAIANTRPGFAGAAIAKTRPVFAGAAIALVCVPCVLVGCPNGREGGGSGAPAGTASNAPPPVPSSPFGVGSSIAGATAASADEARIVPLRPGEAPPVDVAPSEGDVSGLEILFEVRLRDVVLPPPTYGAVASAIAAAQTARVGTLRVALAAGRLRGRIGARTFALDAGWELRGDRHHGGALLVMGDHYRVVPTGALRPLLAERRLDVVPLGPTKLTAPTAGNHLARATRHTSLATTFGTLELDQIDAPPPPHVVTKGEKPDARVDADVAGEPGVDGAGEPLCRWLVELVASDRAIGGAPCSESLVPVRAEIAFSSGGGLIIEATSLREGAIARGELGFPPSGATLVTTSLGDPSSPPIAGDLLLSLRAKGDPSSLELSNRSPQPRLAIVDGVPTLLVPPLADRPLPLRAGKYVVEWRTALGERVERAADVEVPGKTTTSQWAPAPPSSASPIASARNGP